MDYLKRAIMVAPGYDPRKSILKQEHYGELRMLSALDMDALIGGAHGRFERLKTGEPSEMEKEMIQGFQITLTSFDGLKSILRGDDAEWKLLVMEVDRCNAFFTAYHALVGVMLHITINLPEREKILFWALEASGRDAAMYQLKIRRREDKLKIKLSKCEGGLWWTWPFVKMIYKG